jgi:uncharacterized RDD family membrane protein YckC
MECPRCGVCVFAELSTCRDCGWVLSKPYEASHTRQEDGSVQLVDPPATSVPLNGNPTWQRLLWGALVPSGPEASGRSRRRRRVRPEPPADAIAALTQEAYFAERPRVIECLEMPLVQTALDFDSAEAEEEVTAADRIAPLGQRLRAGLFDGALIVSAAAVFFGLFALLGGRLGLERRDLLIYGLATFSLACLYFCLFTYLGGQTPGMQRYRLAPVRFDGGPLGSIEARWRAFGYVVSTGSLLLGFLWALADEEQLTWHDRISRTLLTSLPAHGPKPVS